VISPLLANVYLHHILDQWFEEEVKPRLKGKAFEVRYVDDAVLCFQNQEDAQKVLKVLAKRFSKYGLRLHPEKTRLVEFGRSALATAERMGRKPATFDILGYTHVIARSRRGGADDFVGDSCFETRHSLTSGAAIIDCSASVVSHRGPRA
jgi:RNA-directed DNA polymerase